MDVTEYTSSSVSFQDFINIAFRPDAENGELDALVEMILSSGIFQTRDFRKERARYRLAMRELGLYQPFKDIGNTILRTWREKNADKKAIKLMALHKDVASG